MSSESKLKKLRGSGGFVMALVDDDQQRKGNLGGPDLFLAPVGRLESEKISNYYCNTCEKEYSGSPKIEFENPNEEVAENLILVEKGQYICTTCGSTLAEYRAFKKPNELNDVGNAKPVQSTNVTQESSIASSLSTPQDVSPNLDMFNSSSSTQPNQEVGSLLDESKSLNSKFSSITGMSVYDQNAKKIGIAKQVGVDSSQALTLVITDDNGNDLSINWNKIRKVGEIILVGDETNKNEQSNQKCPNCNFENKKGSKFCENCGTKI